MAVKQVELADNLGRGKGGGAGPGSAKKRMVDALHREITLLKDLDHENIVRYLGYDVKGNTINVFLEYVSGGSVASSIATMGRFEEPLVRSLVCQILCGLEYLHERLIIHRDIKGGNILLDESGVAKISDFGISKKNEYKTAYRYNSRMSIQGSVYWMAPEVIKGKGYSAKVDIWSLGCVVLEMFTGNHPWKQLDELQTMWRLGRENAPPVPDFVSDDAKDFIEKCFTIDPDARPTATDLLHHPFADVDPAEFDFRAYKEAAIEMKRREEEAAELERGDTETDTSDYYDDTEESGWWGSGDSSGNSGTVVSTSTVTASTVTSATATTPTTAGAGAGVGEMYIARVASAKRISVRKSRKVRKSGKGLRGDDDGGDGDASEDGTETGTSLGGDSDEETPRGAGSGSGA
ncbi:hypothetical protein HK104_005024 [Borealophlyctis nickersoniae]|nr:hypothetical protein HK104_005024 [Borealophlyctis nickersoniae]